MLASMAWLAVSGKTPAQILSALQLAPDPGALPAGLHCEQLRNGWFVVCAQDHDWPLLADTVLSWLSDGGSVVSCRIEPRSRISSATCHIDGARVWRVLHDAQEGRYHLDASGQPPPVLVSLHATAIAAQDAAGGRAAAVDCLFDVPIALAEAVTAYRGAGGGQRVESGEE